MAFAVNMDAWRLGNQDVWRDQAQKNWEIENARAEAEAARRQQLFQDDQTDRQRRFANADTYGTGLTAPTTVEGSTARLLQNIGTGEGLGPEFAQYERGYQAPAVAQNPAVNNVTETPNAVTNNVTTGLGMQPPRTSGRGDPAPIAAGLRADLAAQGQRPQAELSSIGASDAIMLRKEIERTRTMLGNAKTDGQRAALQAALADQEKLFGMAQQGYAGAPSDYRANIPQAPEQRVQLAQESVQRQPVAQVQAGPQPMGLRSQPIPDAMGPQQPAEQRQMTVREDPRLAQIKLIGQEAMRKGDTATAAKMAEAYHGVRLESEMGSISWQVLQMTPAQINALASRMGDDVNTGLRGMLLESKFDPATGLATVSVGDKKINLSRTDMAQIASGLYAIERGATDAGYKAIAAVNKSIADLATQQNDLTVKTTEMGNRATEGAARMRNDGLRTDAYVSAQGSKERSKDVPPELNEKFNNLALQLEDPNLDDKARSQIYGQMRVVQTQIANATGQRVNMSGLSDPKPQSLGTRAKIEQDWGKIESKLYENAVTPADLKAIEVKREAFMDSRGVAPSGLMSAVQQGVNPKTGRPLTMQDVDDFNRSYPLSKVDPSNLPWLQKELARQARIDQIPR